MGNILMARQTNEIIEDLKDVECALSPENLTCDGELPIAQVRRRQKELQTERRKLVAELGREPTTKELWGY